MDEDPQNNLPPQNLLNNRFANQEKAEIIRTSLFLYIDIRVNYCKFRYWLWNTVPKTIGLDVGSLFSCQTVTKITGTKSDKCIRKTKFVKKFTLTVYFTAATQAATQAKTRKTRQKKPTEFIEISL